MKVALMWKATSTPETSTKRCSALTQKFEPVCFLWYYHYRRECGASRVQPDVPLPGMLSLRIHPLSTLTTDMDWHVSVVLLRLQCLNIFLDCLIMTAASVFLELYHLDMASLPFLGYSDHKAVHLYLSRHFK